MAESSRDLVSGRVFCDITFRMTQLREFLRHQYIGAIVIGLLAYQGLASLITTVISPIIVFLGNVSDKTLTDKPAISWQQVTPNLVHAALALGLAYVLLRWLHMTQPAVVEEPVEKEPAEQEG
jgi:hypothetical protein